MPDCMFPLIAISMHPYDGLDSARVETVVALVEVNERVENEKAKTAAKDCSLATDADSV